MRVTLDFPAAEEILQEVGLDEQGDTQMFHTKNVLRRIPAGKSCPTQTLRFGRLLLLSTREKKTRSRASAPGWWTGSRMLL